MSSRARANSVVSRMLQLSRPSVARDRPCPWKWTEPCMVRRHPVGAPAWVSVHDHHRAYLTQGAGFQPIEVSSGLEPAGGQRRVVPSRTVSSARHGGDLTAAQVEHFERHVLIAGQEE